MIREMRKKIVNEGGLALLDVASSPGVSGGSTVDVVGSAMEKRSGR